MEPDVKKSKMNNNSKFKHNKKKFYQQKRKQVLQAGHRGFLATCNMNEKACVRECLNLLNHYADKLYGSPDVAGSSDSESDDEALAKCREAMLPQNQRFLNVETGTTNCLFIRTRLNDPVGLGKYIVNDITTSGKAMSRFILRLVPIEAVCRANMPDIINAAGVIFDKYFLKEATTYGIIFNHRYNQQIKRDTIIKELADLVNSKNLANKVDLQHPKKSIIVEVLRGWCLLSVIDNYLGCKKYNLAEIIYPTIQKPKPAAEKADEPKEDFEQTPEESTTKSLEAEN